MFRRQPQVIPAETALQEPTPEQLTAALDRVETDLDGHQTLDGYYFPPDNDEPFHPRTLRVRFVNTGEIHEHESTFPNGAARRANLNLAALGHGPLFVREDDPEHIRKMEEWRKAPRKRTVTQRFLDRAFELIG